MAEKLSIEVTRKAIIQALLWEEFNWSSLDDKQKAEFKNEEHYWEIKLDFILRQIRCDKCEIVLAYNYNFIKREDNYRKGYADGHQSAIHKIHSMIKGE